MPTWIDCIGINVFVYELFFQAKTKETLVCSFIVHKEWSGGEIDVSSSASKGQRVLHHRVVLLNAQMKASLS